MAESLALVQWSRSPSRKVCSRRLKITAVITRSKGRTWQEAAHL